jgi:hypothetical protein
MDTVYKLMRFEYPKRKTVMVNRLKDQTSIMVFLKNKVKIVCLFFVINFDLLPIDSKFYHLIHC